MNKFNIALVDDHKLFRSGLITLLVGLKITNQVYEAGNGLEFLEILKSKNIDVVLMDIDMPEMNGIEATKKALEINPNLKIISLSMYDDDEYYYNMLNAGVSGFLVKDSDIEEVEKAIEIVSKGGKYFSQERLYNIIMNNKSGNQDKDLLTDRELEILNLICLGLSNAEIANKLIISKRTVDKHRENILSKTDCHNTASLIMYASKKGLIS